MALEWDYVIQTKVTNPPKDKGSKDEPNNSKGVEVGHIVTNPANPIILSDKSVLELWVIICPLTAARKTRISLQVYFNRHEQMNSIKSWEMGISPIATSDNKKFNCNNKKNKNGTDLQAKMDAFLIYLDLSEITSSVQDYLHILRADVVIVARRWSHLNRYQMLSHRRSIVVFVNKKKWGL